MVDCSCSFIGILSNFLSVNARVFLLEGGRMDGDRDGPTRDGKEGLMEE